MEDNKSLTSMIIAVVVALIVTGAVLVPIIGGFTDNDGGEGGGSGGGGTEEAVYTFGEAYRQVYPDWPYESYRVYNSTVQGSSPFSITTSDIVDILDNFRSMNIARDFFILLAQITVDTLQIDASIMVSEYTGGGLEYSATFMIQPFDGDSYNVNIFDTYASQNEQQGKQGSFEFVCSSNGAYALNMTYYDYNAGAMQSNSYSGQTSFISFLSENEEGYYDLLGAVMSMSNGLVICPLSEGQDCVVPYSYIHFLEDDSEEYGASVFNANITLNTSDMEFEVTGLPEGVRIWGGIASTDSGYIASDLSGNPLFSSTEYPYEGEIYPMDIYLPTRTGTEGDDDSSSGGNDLGTTGVIMAVIPIFVVLAILMYAVQYLRTKPESY